ncbi:MAG: MBOAT family protein, partial [Spirochaetia bacterium]|nr:MBOAT family protein [Spirochaetia bacterium]
HFLSRKSWLVLSLVINISILAYFKYTNFGIEILNDVHPLGGTIFAWPAAHILLPIGISFFTFQSMSYVIDVYRRVIEPRRSYVDYSMYVAFFPHMVAGPIVRSKTFFAGMDNRFQVKREDMIVGTTRIVHGFFRKLVLSDNLAPLCNGVFAGHAGLHPFDVWLGALAFGWQIYLDFAGYSDVARGVARLFGIEFEINFLYPMAVSNIQEHWSRWHLSFTTWIRDYIFIPLGGSRAGEFRTYINIFITWFFAGVWHGPAYHFILWGVWQGVMVSIYREYARTRLYTWINARGGFVWDIFSRIATMFFLIFGFIWFRAETVSKATQMQGRLFGAWDLLAAWNAAKAWLFNGGPAAAIGNAVSLPAGAAFSWSAGIGKIAPVYSKYAVLVGILFAYEYLFNRLQLEYFWKPENKRKLVFLFCFMILCIIVFAVPDSPNFLYFQF